MKKEMDNRIGNGNELKTRAKEPGFWREIWQQTRLVYYLLRDPEVPFYLKFLPLLAIGYALFPFDILNDFLPLLGQVDDVTALLVGSKLFIELAPPSVVARHMNAIRQQDGFGPFPDEDMVVADAIIIDGAPEFVTEEEPD